MSHNRHINKKKASGCADSTRISVCSFDLHAKNKGKGQIDDDDDDDDWEFYVVCVCVVLFYHFITQLHMQRIQQQGCSRAREMLMMVMIVDSMLCVYVLF